VRHGRSFQETKLKILAIVERLLALEIPLMSQDMILGLAKETLQVTLMVSGPMLVISLVVGILVSIAQVVTSIQDMTLSFVPRVIAVFLAFVFVFPWIMNIMLAFTTQLYGHLERFAR
jgi:flagellar biosynthetic protein FliQ